MKPWTMKDIEAIARRRKARIEAELGFDRELTAIGQPVARPKPARTYTANAIYPLILLCEAHDLPVPIAEYNFSPTRGYRFDYAFIPWKIACEIEGGIWRKGGGAHSHPTGIIRDIEKYNLAARLGWRILRAQPEKLSTLIEPLREMLI